MPDHGGGIPKTIKIGETEFVVADHPELLSLVESGRKDEKNKLYSSIKTLEARINVLKGESDAKGADAEKNKKELEKLQGELKTATDKVAELEGADPKPDPNKDKDPKKEEKATGMTPEEVQAIVDKALETQAKKHEEEINEVKGGLNTKNVEDYRKEKLKEYDGLIIPALVSEGMKSTEDVDKAIEKALETSKGYIRKEYKNDKGEAEQLTLAEIEAREKAKKDAEGGAGAGGQGGTQTYQPSGAGGAPPVPPAGGGDVSGKDLLGKIGGMSLKEFEKNRDSMRQEVRKIAPTIHEEK